MVREGLPAELCEAMGVQHNNNAVLDFSTGPLYYMGWIVDAWQCIVRLL